MKTRSALPFLLAVGLLAAQLQSSAAQDTDALKFVRTAADVASNVQPGAIDGYTAIYIDEENWKAASTDGDLGPFIQAQEARPSRSMACLFSATKNTAVCVYFDGARAYGVSALGRDPGHPYTQSTVAATYMAITPDMLREQATKINFEPVPIALDNGQQLKAYRVKLGE
jgi:hypothetical protein